MNTRAILLVLCFSLAVPAAAKKHEAGMNLKILTIHSVYLYSGLIHRGDLGGQREAAWVASALPEVMRWKVTDKLEGADVVLILMPHGEGYKEWGLSSSCTYVGGELECNSGGTTFRVDCGEDICESSYSPGNYLSLGAAIPLDSSTRTMKAVWGSDSGMGGAARRYLISLDGKEKTQDTVIRSAVTALCFSAGIASGAHCGSMVKRSWKAWNSIHKTGNSVFVLPQ